MLASVSRLVGEVTPREVRGAGDEVRRLMAAYRDKEDLIAIGAYQQGTDPLTDAAIAARTPIEDFLRQAVDDPSTCEDAERRLLELAAYGELVASPDPGVAAPALAAPARAGHAARGRDPAAQPAGVTLERAVPQKGAEAPLRVAGRAVEVDGLVGERWDGEGTPVVLLHAGVADRRAWRDVAPQLDAPVIAYDRRGFGETPPAPQPFTHLDDLLAVLDASRTGPPGSSATRWAARWRSTPRSPRPSGSPGWC